MYLGGIFNPPFGNDADMTNVHVGVVHILPTPYCVLRTSTFALKMDPNAIGGQYFFTAVGAWLSMF